MRTVLENLRAHLEPHQLEFNTKAIRDKGYKPPKISDMDGQHDLSIFLLGDNEFSLYLIEKQLNNRGYNKLNVFSSTAECIAGLEASPDVVFVDAGMGTSHITEQLKQIKRINPNIYLVIIADNGSQLNEQQLQEIGVFEYLIRDWDEVGLMESVLFKISGIKSFLKNASFYI